MVAAVAVPLPRPIPPVGNAPLPSLLGEDAEDGILLMGPRGQVLKADAGSSSDDDSSTTDDEGAARRAGVGDGTMLLDEPVANGMDEDPPWTSVLETRFGVGLEGAAGKDMVYTFATSLPLADVIRRVEETAAAHMPQWQVQKRTVVVKRKIELKTLVRVR